MRGLITIKFSLLFILLCVFGYGTLNLTYGDEKPQSIIIDGDIVEYSTDAKQVTAEGNVVVSYFGSRLTCDKIVVNTQTKEGQASGDVRLCDPRGILEAEKLVYNFQDKTGDILKARLRSSPYYYYGNKVRRRGENRYIVEQGYLSSCNYDRPHFRMKSKRIEIFPGDKVVARSNVLYWMNIPFFYFPRYSHSLKDPFMKMQAKIGKTSDWGLFLLTAFRSDLNDNTHLRLYQDYREKLGHAHGFGLNYDTKKIGRGDFKFYYTHDRPREEKGELDREFQRYLVRLRHMWDIDPATKLTFQYYRIEDKRRILDYNADFLRDYFYREYEKDEQPMSYALVTHAFSNSSINMLIQKRVNNWYNKETEKLPEISYDLPNYQFGESSFYFKNQTVFSNLTNKNPPSYLPFEGGVPADAGKDDDVVRFDIYNQVTYPARLAFLNISPYARLRETAYSKDKFGNSLNPRAAFYTGMDMTTKFYRFFDIKSNFLGLDINKLRHVVTPCVKYGYIHQPTVSPFKLQEFDDIDTIDGDNRFSLELENKLQTKRNEQSVDLAVFRVSSDYIMYSKKDNISKAQDRFTDFLFDLELVPYAWLRMEADAAYDHRQDYFKTVNFDSWFQFGGGRTLGLGHRYDRGASKELTGQLIWRVNPKWEFRIYERYQFATSRRRIMKEQEYTISRNLHCADMDITYNIKRKDDGRRDESIWCIFNLKIFKESEFDYVKSYNPPKISR